MGRSSSVEGRTALYAAIVDWQPRSWRSACSATVTALGETAVTPAGRLASLRMNRDTYQQGVIEVFFDGRLLLSVQDQTLGLGQVGLVVRGESPLHFDSLHAVPLFSQRPVSNPAAY